MKMLSRREFSVMNLKDVAKFHNMDLRDFVAEVYPAKYIIKDSEHFYIAYQRWVVLQTPLAKLL
jgi:hypothetical protein